MLRNHRFPCLVRPLRRLPARSWFPGHKPAHDANGGGGAHPPPAPPPSPPPPPPPPPPIPPPPHHQPHARPPPPAAAARGSRRLPIGWHARLLRRRCRGGDAGRWRLGRLGRTVLVHLLVDPLIQAAEPCLQVGQRVQVHPHQEAGGLRHPARQRLAQLRQLVR